jgi:hypothetical protein
MAGSLLQSCSWHAEKHFRRRGSFASVLWITERPDGHRQLCEAGCTATAQEASDREVLAALVDEIRADAIASGTVAIAVAYLANRSTRLYVRATGAEETLRRAGVRIEQFTAGAPAIAVFREIIGSTLAAAGDPFDPSDSPYAHVLPPCPLRPHEPRGHDVEKAAPS